MVTKIKRHNPSKRTRFILYPAVFVIFLVILSAVLILANGYRIDFQDGKIKLTKTGMLILSTKPANANIYINGKKNSKSTSFYFMPTRMDGLLPGDYNLTLKKSGYRDWTKVVQIMPNLVTWENYVLLFPLDLKIARVDELETKKVIAAWQNRYFVFQETVGNQNVLYLFDEQSRTSKKIWPAAVSLKDQYLASPQISEAVFNLSGNKLLLKVKNGVNDEYAVLDFSSNEQKMYSLSANFKVNITKIVWNPQDENELFYLADGALYRLNVNSTSQTTISSTVKDFGLDKNTLYQVKSNDADSALERSGYDGAHPEIYVKSLVKSPSYKFASSNDGDYLAVLPSESKSLSVFSKKNGKLVTLELGKNIVDFDWSVQNPIIVYHDDNSVYRYDFQRQQEFTFEAPGIKSVDWFIDEYHFVVNAGYLYICDYDGTNQVLLEKDPVQGYYLDQKTSSIIFGLQDGQNSLYKKYIANF